MVSKIMVAIRFRHGIVAPLKANHTKEKEMIPVHKHEEAFSIGLQETAQASVELTPEMFKMLSADIYKDRPLAIVRELLCNGRDAHKEIGQDKPVRVMLPTLAEPYLVFQDYGTGMSHTTIMTTFMRWGYSTKKNSNSAIGMFGIGSKSPLAYTDNFTVISRHEGLETTYSVFLDKGLPNVAKMSQKVISDGSTGLTIQIAVEAKDFKVFENRVKSFVSTFNEEVLVTYGEAISDATLVDIKKPEVVTTTANYQVVVLPNNDYSSRSGLFARMGGVMYNISEMRSELDSLFLKGDHTVILEFPIGALNIAPSRENLSYTEDDDTYKALVSRIKEFNKDIVTTLQKDVEASCNSYPELIRYLSDRSLIALLSNGKYNIPYGVEELLNLLTVKGKDHKTLLGELTSQLKAYYSVRNSSESETAHKEVDGSLSKVPYSRVTSKTIPIYHFSHWSNPVYGGKMAQDLISDYYRDYFNSEDAHPDKLKKDVYILLIDRKSRLIEYYNHFSAKGTGDIVLGIKDIEDLDKSNLVGFYENLGATVKVISIKDTFYDYVPKSARQTKPRNSKRLSGVFKFEGRNNKKEIIESSEIDTANTVYINANRNRFEDGLFEGLDIMDVLTLLKEVGYKRDIVMFRKSISKSTKEWKEGLTKFDDDFPNFIKTTMNPEQIAKCIANYSVGVGGFYDISSTVRATRDDKVLNLVLSEFPATQAFMIGCTTNKFTHFHESKGRYFIRFYHNYVGKVFDKQFKAKVEYLTNRLTERKKEAIKAEIRLFEDKYKDLQWIVNDKARIPKNILAELKQVYAGKQLVTEEILDKIF